MWNLRTFKVCHKLAVAPECVPIPQLRKSPVVRQKWPIKRGCHLAETHLIWSKEQRTKYLNHDKTSQELSKWRKKTLHNKISFVNLLSSHCLLNPLQLLQPPAYDHIKAYPSLIKSLWVKLSQVNPSLATFSHHS